MPKKPSRDEIIQALMRAFPANAFLTPAGKLAIKVDNRNLAGVNQGSRNILILPNIASTDPRIVPARGAKLAKKMIVPEVMDDVEFAKAVIRDLIEGA